VCRVRYDGCGEGFGLVEGNRYVVGGVEECEEVGVGGYYLRVEVAGYSEGLGGDGGCSGGDGVDCLRGEGWGKV